MPRAAVFALAIALSSLAHAQPAKPPADDQAKAEAAALYDEGKRHFDIGEYAQAIAAWKQSYLRSSEPLLLFNIAQAYRLANNCAQANRFYLNYKRAEKRPKNQAELDKAMARCAGVEPATGDAASEPAAPPADTAARTSQPGAPPVETTTPTAPPAPAATSASPAAPSAAAPLAPSSRGGGLRIAGLVTGAVGVVALGASGLYAIAARQDSDKVSSARMGTPFTGDIVKTDRNGSTAAGRARGLLGAGAALAVAGGVMWYLGHRQGAQVDVAIAPGHSEVVLTCAF